MRPSLRPIVALAALWLAGPCLSAPVPNASPAPPPLGRALTAREKELPQELPQDLQDILARHTPGHVKVTGSKAHSATAHASAVQPAATAPLFPPNGSQPDGLTLGSDGNYYGVANTGGVNDHGVIFQLAVTDLRGIQKVRYRVLYTFSGQEITGPDSSNQNADGIYPIRTLMEDRNSPGTFYGATYEGGVNGTGTLFRVTSKGVLSTVHSFAALGADGRSNADGTFPVGSLCQAADGNFYGVAALGGTSGLGTVYRLTSSGEFTLIHTLLPTEGTQPAPLVEDGSNPGTFYSVTRRSGRASPGMAFRITSAGALTVVHGFTNAEGYPGAALLLASDGNFYGTSEAGAKYRYGAVFKMDRAGNVTVIKTFSGTNGDGSQPMAPLVEDRNTPGDLYGETAYGGGNGNNGTVFRLQTRPLIFPPGTVFDPEPIIVHSFDGQDGSYPTGGLVQNTEGGFFGTTIYGGASNQTQNIGNGVVFGAGSGGAEVVANLNPGTYDSVAASTTGSDTSTPSVPNADYANPARVG